MNASKISWKLTRIPCTLGCKTPCCQVAAKRNESANLQATKHRFRSIQCRLRFRHPVSHQRIAPKCSALMNRVLADESEPLSRSFTLRVDSANYHPAPWKMLPRLCTAFPGPSGNEGAVFYALFRACRYSTFSDIPVDSLRYFVRYKTIHHLHCSSAQSRVMNNLHEANDTNTEYGSLLRNMWQKELSKRQQFLSKFSFHREKSRVIRAVVDVKITYWHRETEVPNRWNITKSITIGRRVGWCFALVWCRHPPIRMQESFICRWHVNLFLSKFVNFFCRIHGNCDLPSRQ